MNQPSESFEQPSATKETRSWWIFGGTVVFFWFTQFLGLLPLHASSEFYGVASPIPIFIATILTIFFAIILLFWKGGVRWILLGSLLWMFLLWMSVGSADRFKSRVMNPIPAGVADITAKGYSLFGNEWAFEFQAERSSIDAIIAHHELKCPPLENLESLRLSAQKGSSGKVLIPAWVADLNGGEALEFHLKKTPDSDKSRGRELWLVFNGQTKRAWFLNSAPN